MPPRAIWGGAISFGLVNVPVKVYSAISRKTIRFHQLHDRDAVPIRRKEFRGGLGKGIGKGIGKGRGEEAHEDRQGILRPSSGARPSGGRGGPKEAYEADKARVTLFLLPLGSSPE
jgi:Ku70/Ku80-like protein